MISRFNSQLRRGCSPLFLADGRGRPPGQRRREDLNGPEEPAIADQRELNLESGRSLQTRNAGIFLFLPLLVKLRFDRMATDAGYPGSKMVPSSSALLALLMLKLLDKERRGHINDFNFDEALGLFAGLNVLPKKSFATDYSYRTTREHQRALLRAWVGALGKVMFPAAHTFSVDFHPIPYRGDPTGLDRHYIPCRGAAGPSIQTFFALEQESRCLCYANANLIRSDQPGELMQFVTFWHALTGQDPQWLYFDSKLVDYPELSNINKRDIHFITIRRRGAAILAGWTHYHDQAGREPSWTLHNGAINGSGMWMNPSNFVATKDRSVSSRSTGSAARNQRYFSRIILRRRLEISSSVTQAAIEWRMVLGSVSTSSISTAWRARSDSTWTWTQRLPFWPMAVTGGLASTYGDTRRRLPSNYIASSSRRRGSSR